MRRGERENGGGADAAAARHSACGAARAHARARRCEAAGMAEPVAFRDITDGSAPAAFDAEALRQRVVYLVDCGASMRAEWEGDAAAEAGGGGRERAGSFLEAALGCVRSDAMRRIVSRPGDQIGVLLYNTRESKNDIYSENVCVAESLKQPDAAFMRMIDSLTAAAEFERKYGTRDAMGGGTPASQALVGALRVAQKHFSDCSTSSCDKIVIVFTNDADPTGGSEDAMEFLSTRFHDVVKQRLAVKVMPLPSAEAGDAADSVEAFYARALESAVAEERKGVDLEDSPFALRTEVLDTPEDANDMDALIESGASNNMRTAGQLHWKLEPPGTSRGGKGAWLRVMLFACLAPPWTSSGKKVKLDRKTNAELVSDRIVISNDTADMIAKENMGEDMKKCWSSARSQEKVVFTTAELAAIKSPMRPGMHLLGFRPIDWFDRLQLGHIANPLVMCADEHRAPGSGDAFSALHSSMISKAAGAVCLLQQRTNTQPMMVWVQPVDETAADDAAGSEGNEQSPTMLLFTLPYKDDLRPVRNNWRELHSAALTKAVKSKVPLEVTCPVASDAAVAAARELVDAHKMRTFDVSQFTDPALDRHFAVLQALALREDSLPEQKEDPTNPDYESKPWAAHARRVAAAEGFNAAVRVDTEKFEEVIPKVEVKPKVERKPATKKKTETPPDGEGNRGKKARTE